MLLYARFVKVSSLEGVDGVSSSCLSLLRMAVVSCMLLERKHHMVVKGTLNSVGAYVGSAGYVLRVCFA